MSSRIDVARPTRFISTTAVAAAAIGLLMLTAASASASASAATTIYACVSKKSGATWTVSAKAKCKRGEHKLSWNWLVPRGRQVHPGRQVHRARTGWASTSRMRTPAR